MALSLAPWDSHTDLPPAPSAPSASSDPFDAPPAVRTRIRLHHVPPAALAALAAGDLPTAQPHFPFKLTPFLVSDACTRTWAFRAAQVALAPRDGPWVTRILTVYTPTGGDGAVEHREAETETVIGRAGFHGAPDQRGMVEVGYHIAPPARRRGYATAVLKLLMAVARQANGDGGTGQVRVVRASVGERNEGSVRVVERAGFVKVGREWDEEDGWEDVWELEVGASF